MIVNTSCIDCTKNKYYITLSSQRLYKLTSTPFHENKNVSPPEIVTNILKSVSRELEFLPSRKFLNVEL